MSTYHADENFYTIARKIKSQLSLNNENTDTTTALVAADIDFHAEDMMQERARKKRRTGADGSFSTSYVRDRTFVTNSHATESRSTTQNIFDEIQATKLEHKQIKDEQEVLRRMFDQLKEKFKWLYPLNEQDIRQGFISCFKRDILRAPTEEDHRYIIRAGTRVAHCGICFRDCHLYESGARADFAVFEKIYGLPPAVIQGLDPTGDARDLLDKHGTLYADKERPPPETFHSSFALFIEAFKDNDYPINYLQGDGVVARRHREFLESCCF